MTGATFLLSWLAIPLLGLPAAVAFGPSDSRIGRVSFAFGAGAIVLTLVMLGLTAARVPWAPVPIFLAASPTLLCLLLRQEKHSSQAGRLDARAIPGLVAAGVALLAAAYAAGTARATSADYLYFWGTKGQEFALARQIDAAFLREPDHFLLHPDYPPLLPCLYAWGAMAAGRFPWGAALLTVPIFFGLTLGAFWGYARSALGDARAALSSAFLGALLGFGFIASKVAGNAEPALLLFETLALGILVFGRRAPRNDIAASLALAGCALTKFEGAVFTAAAVAAFVLFERRGAGRAATLCRLSPAPAVALGIWLAFCARNGLLDNYTGGKHGAFTLANLSGVAAGLAKSASYGAAFLPWILLLAVWASLGWRRESLAPAAVAAVFFVVNASFYLHGAQDPAPWIVWSGSRIFLTPLVCLVFAASARAPE